MQSASTAEQPSSLLHSAFSFCMTMMVPVTKQQLWAHFLIVLEVHIANEVHIKESLTAQQAVPFHIFDA